MSGDEGLTITHPTIKHRHSFYPVGAYGQLRASFQKIDQIKPSTFHVEVFECMCGESQAKVTKRVDYLKEPVEVLKGYQANA